MMGATFRHGCIGAAIGGAHRSPHSPGSRRPRAALRHRLHHATNGTRKAGGPVARSGGSAGIAAKTGAKRLP
jgi:hypothetical protein